MDWYDIKFLESSTNLRREIWKTSDREVSASLATDVSVCLQQGRLFFEAADASPLQIKPLQVYYGIVGFAAAIVAGRTRKKLATQRQSHGLVDITPANGKLRDLMLKIESNGLFQSFSEEVAPLGRLCFYEESMSKWTSLPYDTAQNSVGKVMGMKDIFSRVPRLEGIYAKSFDVPAKTRPMHIDFRDNDRAELRIDDDDQFKSRKDLVALVKKLRGSYPFLNSWCLSEAYLAWDNSVLTFKNVEKGGLDDLAEDVLMMKKPGDYSVGHECIAKLPSMDPTKILPPLAGGITRDHTWAIECYENANLSEYSYQFLGSFLLSSLVRYRPSIWQNAISRTATSETPSDDGCLAMIEQFLDLVIAEFPKFVVHSILYPSRR